MAKRQLQTPAHQPKAGPSKGTTPDTPVGPGEGLNQAQVARLRGALEQGKATNECPDRVWGGEGRKGGEQRGSRERGERKEEGVTNAF